MLCHTSLPSHMLLPMLAMSFPALVTQAYASLFFIPILCILLPSSALRLLLIQIELIFLFSCMNIYFVYDPTDAVIHLFQRLLNIYRILDKGNRFVQALQRGLSWPSHLKPSPPSTINHSSSPQFNFLSSQHFSLSDIILSLSTVLICTDQFVYLCIVPLYHQDACSTNTRPQ